MAPVPRTKFLKLLVEPSPTLFSALLIKQLKSPIANQGPANELTMPSIRPQKLALPLTLEGPYTAKRSHGEEGGSD